MKLAAIWNSSKAWEVLSKLKKNPKLAYRLLKYEKKVSAELEVLEAHRQKLVYEAAGVEPPAIVSLGVESPEFIAFSAKFQEFAQGESDLAWAGITMDDLIEALGAETANVLSEHDIELLEPFFTAPEPVAAPNLQLVKTDTPPQ